jgi:hypothetical protein
VRETRDSEAVLDAVAKQLQDVSDVEWLCSEGEEE